MTPPPPGSAVPPSRSRLSAPGSSPAATTPKVTLTKPPLPGLPKRPLTPAQQAQALARTQAQAEQRVKLGVQLFKAAEAQAAQRRDVLEQLKLEQAELRQQVKQDIAKAMESYEARLDKFDDQITDSVHKLEARIAELQTQWLDSQQRIEQMIARSETLLSQSRSMIESPTKDGQTDPTPAMDVTADDDVLQMPEALSHLEREDDPA